MTNPETPNAEPQMPNPVAWLIFNGWSPVAVHLSSAAASADRDRRQMSNDLSGNLAAHYVFPAIPVEAAQAYAEALAAARLAQERERCVAWINARKDAFCYEHGYIDPDTGFLEFGRGEHAQAKHDYVSELEEIADGIRALSTQPPETGKEK